MNDTDLQRILSRLDIPVEPESGFSARLESALFELKQPPQTAWRTTAAIVIGMGVFLVVALISSPAAKVDPSDEALGVPTVHTTTSATSTTSIDFAPVLPPEGAFTRELVGVLPDGTPYTVSLEEGMSSLVTMVSGFVMLDNETLGTTSFLVATDAQGSTFSDGRLEVRSGNWVMVVRLYDHILERLGPTAGAVLESSIRSGTPVNGLPVIELSEPFRWATDQDIPNQMGVVYADALAVRRGCGDLAVACSETRSVQAIPTGLLFSMGPTTLPPLYVTSTAPRPESDPAYLDPGPLQPRGTHSVLWTGTEMIVWGGATADGTGWLNDGAAFDPSTATWRLLPPGPVSAVPNVAVWSGGEMIVVTTRETSGFDPATWEWRPIGAGTTVGPEVNLTDIAVVDDRLILWANATVRSLDLNTGAWSNLPPVGVTGSTHALRVFDGEPFARGMVGQGCNVKRIFRLVADQWQLVPDVSLDTPGINDCSHPQQFSGGQGKLFVWEDDLHPTMLLEAGATSWRGLPPPPLGGCEGSATRPIAAGRWILVGACGTPAAFDLVAEEWFRVEAPGGWSDDAVWTGEEVLLWGNTCCYGAAPGTQFRIDAWRWKPDLP